jgi:hypothetical protein
LETTVDNATQVLDPIQTPVAVRRGGARLVITVCALVALLGAALTVARDAGTPTVEDKAQVVAEVSTAAQAEEGAPANLAAQIIFPPLQAIVCPILAAVALRVPAFALGIINALRVFFGCVSP